MMVLNQVAWLVIALGLYAQGLKKGFRRGVHMGIQYGLKGKKFLHKNGLRK